MLQGVVSTSSWCVEKLEMMDLMMPVVLLWTLKSFSNFANSQLPLWIPQSPSWQRQFKGPGWSPLYIGFSLWRESGLTVLAFWIKYLIACIGDFKKINIQGNLNIRPQLRSTFMLLNETAVEFGPFLQLFWPESFNESPAMKFVKRSLSESLKLLN